MSLSKAKDEMNENIEASKRNESQPSRRDMTRCGTESITRLSAHPRARSISAQKSKIPTNVGPVIRPASLMHAQLEDNSPNLNATSTDDTTFGKAQPINSGRFPASKSLTTALSSPVTIKTNKSSNNCIGGSTIVKRSLENQFATRKKRYAKLKEELSAKQKNAAELYSEMLQLREKMITSGTKDPGQIETINLTSTVTQDPTKSLSNNAPSVGGDGEHASAPYLSAASELQSAILSKIKDLPKACHEMCSQMLIERSKFLESLTACEDLQGSADIKSKIDRQIETVKNESTLLKARLEEAKNLHGISIEVTQKYTTLWNELELSRKKINQLENIKQETINTMTSQLDAALNEKESAKVECGRLRESELTLHTELQKLRTKIRGMEAKTNEDDLKIGKLQSNAKNFEMQLKSKSSSANTQLKDMEKNLKNSQSLLAKAEKQRDSVQSRLIELKKDIISKENETMNRMNQMSDQLAAVNLELSKERQLRQNELSKEKEVCNVALDERLAGCIERVATLQRQKREIIEAINPALLNSGKDLGSNDESKSHDKIIESLTKTIHELRLNSKVASEKNEELQRRLSETDDLRFSINELTRRNEELEIALNQKQLEIEEQDRVIKERRNMMKVRDAAINRDEVNNGEIPGVKKAHNQRDRQQVDLRTAEKTENVQQLYSVLEAKQVQITRLEQLVEQMEIQQERAQEQRTRLEKKIAQFQLAMHYKKGQGYVNPENHELSTTKISNLRKSPQQNGCPPLSCAKTFLSSLQSTSRVNPRSSSRRRQCTSATTQPCMQRSKSFNSINFKTHSVPSAVYASQIMDEVARALKRERDYDYKKRILAADGIAECPRKDRRTIRADYLDITEDEIRESFYNWLVEPWMFSGTPSNVVVSSNDRCGNHWTTDCSPSATLSVRVRTSDRSRHRQRLTNNCSKTKCESTERQRGSEPERSCLAIPLDVQTKIHTAKNNSLRSRKKRS